MSYLAIGAVTKAIAELLSKKLNKPPLMGRDTNLRVTTLPPDDDRVSAANGVNLFLYRVIECPFMKNNDWRGDQTNPIGAKRPPLALVLHYLLTAYAKKAAGSVQDDITAHQLLGNAMAILHEYPVLNDVHDSDFDADLDTQFAPELRRSFEKIKITMASVSMEEIAKIIWTGPTSAYRLSVPYQVTMIQIAPIIPTKMPGIPVQQTGLHVSTYDAPVISSIDPSIGPAGARVTIKGNGFKAKGLPTSVILEGIILAETDLERLSEEEIILSVPAAPQRGPKPSIIVAVGGRESNPAYYEIQPWISSIQPLRGLTGIPLTIPFDIPSGATVGVEIDGQAAIVTPDPTSKLVQAIVPTNISTNGPKPVVLTIDGSQPQRSNTRFFEVLPHIGSVNVTTTTSGLIKTTISVVGQRLNGKDVYVKYGTLLLQKGENISPTQLVVEVDRLIPQDQPVSVLVNNLESNPLPPHLERFEPSETFAGDSVKLIGRGLSGQNVTVYFGNIPLNLGAQAYSSQLSVTVPSTLGQGAVEVKVTVDGNDSNSLQFEVVA